MWGSAMIEDDFGEVYTHTTTPVEEVAPIKKQHHFAPNGDGWFEATLGCNAETLVKRLRKARRNNKDNRSEIDNFINDVRMIKSLETDMTIKSLSWSEPYENTIKQLGLDDRKLKSLRKFGESRCVNLERACMMWDKAEQTLKMLDEHEDVWGVEEQQAWASAMQDRSAARKMWSNALHPTDKLTKAEKDFLEFASQQLLEKGPMKVTTIRSNFSDAGMLRKSHTDRKLTTLMNMYGEDMDIVKGAKRGTYVRVSSDGLVLKDVWSYSAGFIDADGYITITERGEPRAGMIATGDRGKIHCEDLYKTLECGVLSTDNKVYKDSQRSQHRLQFYSKADLRKLLHGVSPHLKMKSVQARAVLAYLDEKDTTRKQELKRLVRYENWKDDKRKSNALLQEWGIDMDTIGKYREGL
tara:strand:- start:1295 stop:2527 length:1233 start_codon:yes stop_codon:yes gene_type:complete